MKRKISMGLCFAIALGTLLGCGKKSEEIAKVKAAEAVKVMTVSATPVWDEEEVVGSVEAAQRAVLSAKVTGVVDAINVAPGVRVKKGEVLVTIDAREIRARLDQAEAGQDQAQKDYARIQRLLKSGSATQQEFDAATMRLKTSEAALVEARAMLGYTEISAPFDGVVTKKFVEVGDLASPGKPLLEEENSSLLRFESEIPEALINRVGMGSKFPVRVEAADANLEGVVTEIAPSASAGSRTFLVKLDLTLVENMRAGQFGRLRVPVKERPAIMIPEAAVVRRGQIETVFVLRDGVVRLRLVKTGRTIGNDVEILSGLAGGESVVVVDADRLQDGIAVEVAE